MNIFIMKRKLLMAVLMFLGLGGALSVNAQNFTGSAPANGAEIILYNVGTGAYINGSGIWGTQLCLLPNGQFFTLSGNGNTYYIENGKTHLGFGQGDDSEKLFNDNGKASFTFTKVGSTYKYNITTENKYIVAGALTEAIKLESSIEDTDENAQWMLITRKELEERFNIVASGTELGAASAEGTYLIPDPNFARGYVPNNTWIVDGGTVFNDYKEKTSNGKHVRVKPTGETVTYDNSSKGTAPKTGTKKVTYYGGIGYDSECKYARYTFTSGYPWNPTTNTYSEFWDEDAELLKQLSGKDTPDDQHINRYLGGLYTANIHGAGKVYMNKITAPVDGWYRISCKGFTTKTAKLYAKTTNGQTDKAQFRETDENTLVYTDATDTPATYAQAAVKLQKDEYAKGVMVYASAGKTIEFGIEETAELGTDETGEKVWACFDDFALYYLGVEKEPYFYLNEAETDMNLLKEQVCTNGTHGLYLQRKLTAGQWNSIILPINMTGRQIQSAFGEATKLSELKGIEVNDKYLIKFASVNLANKGIEAGKHYIIKPSSDKEKKTAGEYKFKRVQGNETLPANLPDQTLNPTDANPVYYIPSVTFSSLAKTDNGIIVSEGIPGNEETGSLVFKGTYTNQTNDIIPVGSFILASNGDWYHTQTKAYSVKGFRTWIETSNVPGGTEIAFEINGIQENGGTVTNIEGLEMQPATKHLKNIYDINGRIVRSNGTTEGLEKGIYIVNGKKVIVK